MNITETLSQYTLRESQEKALSFVKEYSKDFKFFLLDLPTGIGKSLLAAKISQFFIDQNKDIKIDIVTQSKMLQRQYINDFSFMQNLWGKDNYHCDQWAVSCGSGKEFNKLKKTQCENCPYINAKEQWTSGNVSLTNFHYFVLNAIYQPKFLETRNAKVLIIDEAHSFQQILSDSISVNLTEFMIKKLDLKNQKKVLQNIGRITDIDDFISYLNDFLIIEVSRTIAQVRAQMSNFPTIEAQKRDNKFNKILDKEGKTNLKIADHLGELEIFMKKIKGFIEEVEINKDNWVLEKKMNENGVWEASVEPIWSADYLEKYIWSYYDYVFFMSGTILEKKMFGFLNGLDKNKLCYLNLSSPFEAKQRPIYYFPIAKMTYNTKQHSFNLFKPYLHKFLDKYKNNKGIIHTVNFELSEWIKTLNNDRLLFHDSKTKDKILTQHFESEIPTVLVSPSMHTGLSLDDSLSRFQIIVKMPYPSLGSAKNKKRIEMYPEWYGYETVCALLQMCGRSIRNENDWAHTLIMDKCFGDVLSRYGQFFPQWILEAIKTVKV